MSVELKEKLASVEDNLRGLKEDRAAKVAEREKAKEAYADLPADADDSEQHQTTMEAVRAVGELDEQIAVEVSRQSDILKMLGDTEEQMRGGDAPKSQSLDLPLPNQSWSTALALGDPKVRSQLEFFASSKSKFGSIDLGQVADRDVLVTDLAFGLLPNVGARGQRESTEAPMQRAITRPFTVLDLIPTGTTDGNSVPYTIESPLTGGPTEVAEGAAKPELYFDFTDADSPVVTIAGYMKVRKQALADFGALATIMDQRLRYLLRKRLEQQVLSGNGTGGNLQGILTHPSIGSISYSSSVPMTEHFLSGITNVSLNDGAADAIVVNPADWYTALTERAHFGGGAGAAGTAGSYEYIGGGPFGVTPANVWGIPLLTSQAITKGTALVGDFGLAVTLLVREGVTVLLSDSDQDDFIRNRVTMLGETRVGLPIWRPTLFQKVALA